MDTLNNPIYFKELKRYSYDALKEKIGDKEIINNLVKKGYLRFKESYYSFNFVGIISIDNILIRCFPKYIENKEDDEKLDGIFKEVIHVIKKYKKLYEDIGYDNIESEDLSSNLLSLMIFFIEDYYENGLYSKFLTVNQVNGIGEIDWNKSINENIPLIKNKKPYYMELVTRYNLNDTNNIIRLLHECIITTCSKKLESVGLMDLFDLTPVDISDKDIADFNQNSILKKLEQALYIEFNTHKQKLLRCMIAMISKENIFGDNDTLSIYGTSTFHVIWEEVCRQVLGDNLDKTLETLDEENYLPNGLNEFGKKTKKLISLIDKPKWEIGENFFQVVENEEYENGIKKNTLRPDLILFYKKNFIVLDAKYYVMDYNGDKLTKQPGIGSITKQYLYELAYKDFIEKTGFLSTKNGFLFPSSGTKIKNIGFVKLDFISKLIKDNNNLFDDEYDIQLIMIPASKMYEHYLDGTMMLDLTELKIKGLYE